MIPPTRLPTYGCWYLPNEIIWPRSLRHAVDHQRWGRWTAGHDKHDVSDVAALSTCTDHSPHIFGLLLSAICVIILIRGTYVRARRPTPPRLAFGLTINCNRSHCQPIKAPQLTLLGSLPLCSSLTRLCIHTTRARYSRKISLSTRWGRGYTSPRWWTFRINTDTTAVRASRPITDSKYWAEMYQLIRL